MIYDSIKNHSKYNGLGKISKALLFLSTHDTSHMNPGKIEIEDQEDLNDHMFANVIELTSKDVKDCVFEAHRKYIDIHFIIKGTEGIGYAKVENLEPTHKFDEDKDIGFYSGLSEGTLFLSNGDFIICYPGEAHMVAIANGDHSHIKKIVVKIKA